MVASVVAFTGQAIGLAGGPKDSNKNTVPPLAGDVPDVAPQARVMADQWVLMARSETLEKLGEHRDAEAPSNARAAHSLSPRAPVSPEGTGGF